MSGAASAVPAGQPIPRELERVVVACLARRRDDRPTAAELSQALGALRIRPWTEKDAAGWWESRARYPASIQ